MKKQFIYYLILISLYCLSCNRYVIINETNCHIEKDYIKEYFKKKKIRNLNLSIIKGPHDRTQYDCIGYYLLKINKWKNVKTRFLKIYIPMLKSDDMVYINIGYNQYSRMIDVDSTFLKQNTKKEFDMFLKDNKESLDSLNIELIEKKYKEGLYVWLQGTLFR